MILQIEVKKLYKDEKIACTHKCVMLLLLAKTPYSNSSIWFERKLLKKGKLHAQTYQLYKINWRKILSYEIFRTYNTRK